mgnify:CR=1 FL=1
MSQSNVLTRELVTLVGLESTFANVPAGSFPNAMTTLVVMNDDLPKPKTEILPNQDLRTRRFDILQPVHGLTMDSEPPALSCYLKATPSAQQLVASASPTGMAVQIPLIAAFGTIVQAAGSTVTAAGSSGTTVQVQVGDINNFIKGTVILVQTSVGMEWAVVEAISVGSHTLTVSPKFQGTHTDGNQVRNLYNCIPTEGHTKTLSIQRAHTGDTAAQWTFYGCRMDVAFTLPEPGKLPFVTFTGKAASYVGFASQSITIPATITDDMNAPAIFAPQVYVYTHSAGVAGPRSGLKLVAESYTVTFKNNWEMVRDGGAVDGAGNATTIASVVNTGGKQGSVQATLKLRWDSSWHSTFTGQTDQQLVIVQQIGTGTAATFWIFQMPVAQIIAETEPTKVGDRVYQTLTFEGRQDNTITPAGGETTTQLDAIYAPLRVAFG